MEELIKKLNKSEQETLGNLLEQANEIIDNSDNLTEEDVGTTYERSKLKGGIAEVMCILGRWC